MATSTRQKPNEPSKASLIREIFQEQPKLSGSQAYKIFMEKYPGTKIRASEVYGVRSKLKTKPKATATAPR